MYTSAQLESLYASLTGHAPDTATRLTIQALALQSQVGVISDADLVTYANANWTPTPAEPDPTPANPATPVPGPAAPPVNAAQALTTYYASVMGRDIDQLGAADQAALTGLIDRVGVGAMSLADAQQAVSKMARGAISAVNLSYQFFTGATPYEAGVAYLLAASDDGLSGAAVSLEARYITFAVNLGKFGEGAARFAAGYGALSLTDALIKAYAEIFGEALTSARAGQMLAAQVVVGDQTLTRAQALARYGDGDLQDLGTKAAVVGWLLAEAVTADAGPYAQAQDAFLADLGPDGLAHFHVDLLSVYGTHVAAPAGATIKVAHDQSVSTAAEAALKATNNSDVILGQAGLDAGRTIATGQGDDRVTFAGAMNGKIVLGDGASVVTLADVGATGAVSFGKGQNVVNVSGVLAAGASLSAEGTNNTLRLTSADARVAGTVTGFQVVVLEAPVAADALAGVAGARIIYDQVASSVDPDVKVAITAANHETVVLKDTRNGVVVTDTTAEGARELVVHLDHFAGAATTQADRGAGYAADGGSITLFATAQDGAAAGPGKVTLHVDSDSTAGLIYAATRSTGQTAVSPSAIPTLELRGTGKLTAQVAESFTWVDASHAGQFDLTYAVAGGVGLDTLKTAEVGRFIFSNWTSRLSVAMGHAADKDYAAPMTFALGAGENTIVVTKGETGLNNLAMADGAVVVTAEVTGFDKGVDHLVLDAVTQGRLVAAQDAADAAASLTDAVQRVAAKVAANALAVFSYAGDTYVFVQDLRMGLNMSDGAHAGDGLIKLSGVTGLSVVSGAAVGDIHWA